VGGLGVGKKQKAGVKCFRVGDGRLGVTKKRKAGVESEGVGGGSYLHATTTIRVRVVPNLD
jgi:hypothetical protein